MLLRNTLIISLYSTIAGFPLPIIFAMMLNNLTNKKFKKTAQMITYAPHFISTVVFCGMIIVFLDSDGIINVVRGLVGLSPVRYMAKPELFRHIYVWSGIFKGLGWSTILYLAVLSAVSPELHESATIDGASKFQRVLYIDFPSILPTVIIVLILNVGSIMSVGFEKAFLLQNPINLDYSEIISTYVYKIGLLGGRFSYSAAIGLFNNVINAVLLIIVNTAARKLSETSLW